MKKIFNYATGRIELIFNKDEEKGPVEILIYDDIGKDPWTREGVSAKDIKLALDEITPRNRELRFRTNSSGGSVSEGLTIRSLLQDWPGRIVNIIDGVAASAASWCIPADEVQARKASQMFVHKSMAIVWGNSDAMKEAIAFLDTTDGQIAEMYSEKTGKPVIDMLKLMADETLMTGQQAKDLGFVDTLIEGDAVRNFSALEFNAMKQKLAALNSLRISAPKTEAGNTEKLMNKKQMSALLNKWGVKIPSDATDEQLIELVNAGPPAPPAPVPPPPPPTNAAPDSKLIDMQKEIDALKSQNSEANRVRITNEIQKLVDNDQLPAALREKAINRCVKDESALEEYRSLPSRPPGSDPLGASNSDTQLESSASITDIVRAVKKFGEPMNALKLGNNNVTMQHISNAAAAKSRFLRTHNKKIIEAWNANTIDATFKRDAILNTVIVDFARRLIPLQLFSTVFQNVPLMGTNKVQIPFLDLDTVASISWDPAVGYTNPGGTVIDNREIEIGTGAANGDRLRVGLGFTSEEVARQPYLKIVEMTQLKVNKLASDIIADVLSIVTAANYGAAAFTGGADTFDSDDIADMVLACKLWPLDGRGMILDTAYHVNLLKDPAFKSAMNAASDLAIKEGRLFPRVEGFDYSEWPTIPTNGENLIGMAIFKSAILFATAPVPPLEEVRRAGTGYEVITEPNLGVSFEYRSFGDNVLDSASHWVELSYGFAKGNGNALKRMVSA